MGLNDDDMADVFQETFRAVAKHLASFQPTRATGSFRSWLRAITRSKSVDLFRRQNREAIGAGGTAAQIKMSNIANPVDLDEETEEEAEKEHNIVVQRAMELIQPEFAARNWTAFQMVVIEGRTAVEVAEELGVQPQAVRQANYRIRRRLRVLLQDFVEVD